VVEDTKHQLAARLDAEIQSVCQELTVSSQDLQHKSDHKVKELEKQIVSLSAKMETNMHMVAAATSAELHAKLEFASDVPAEQPERNQALIRMGVRAFAAPKKPAQKPNSQRSISTESEPIHRAQLDTNPEAGMGKIARMGGKWGAVGSALKPRTTKCEEPNTAAGGGEAEQARVMATPRIAQVLETDMADVVWKVTNTRFEEIQSELKEVGMQLQMVAHACVVLSSGETCVGRTSGGLAASSVVGSSKRKGIFTPVQSSSNDDDKKSSSSAMRASSLPGPPLSLPSIEKEAATPPSPKRVGFKSIASVFDIKAEQVKQPEATGRASPGSGTLQTVSVPEGYGRFNAPKGSTAELEHMLLDRGVKQKADVEDLKFSMEQLRQRVCTAEKTTQEWNSVMSVLDLGQLASDLQEMRRGMVHGATSPTNDKLLPSHSTHQNRQEDGASQTCVIRNQEASVLPRHQSSGPRYETAAWRMEDFIGRMRSQPCTTRNSRSLLHSTASTFFPQPERVATSSPGTAMKGLKSVHAPSLSPQWKRPGSVTLGKSDMAEKACK